MGSKERYTLNNYSSAPHYQEIIATLQDYCANQYSGTMFITTNNNHSVRFILKNGIIVFVAYRFQYGNEAIPLVQKIESGIFSFKKDIFVGKEDPTLLDTNTLLQILSNSQTAFPSASNEDKTKQSNPVATTQSATKFVSDEKIKHVTTELALFIGPIAAVICEEYIEDYGQPNNQSEWEEMLNNLAEEISDKEKQGQFKTKLIDL